LSLFHIYSVFLSLSLFICIDIQEFYEVTLLNSQKSCEHKLVEVNHMAEQWEHTPGDPCSTGSRFQYSSQ
uniref:Uncharacterized protein n=1 Tax=Sinocyclocheilus grahami TaxID=75366 RepID=A0A672L468_SINGR